MDFDRGEAPPMRCEPRKGMPGPDLLDRFARSLMPKQPLTWASKDPFCQNYTRFSQR